MKSIITVKTRILKKTEAVNTDGKIWSKETIQELLDKSDEAVYRAMKQIYAKQTADEQKYQDTHMYNSVGFTGADAEIMSSFTEYYEKFGKLSPKQMVIARKKMKKYWKQLLNVIRESNPNQPERVGVVE
jgi:high-affinity Fe2+/Pb2+ permease